MYKHLINEINKRKRYMKTTLYTYVTYIKKACNCEQVNKLFSKIFDNGCNDTMQYFKRKCQTSTMNYVM